MSLLAQLREVSHSATSPHNETVILSPTVDSLCEELANTTLLDRANHSQATQQHEATLNVSVAPPPPPIPQDILAMSDVELRDKLVSLGEQPGPVNSGTRSAYQAYLAKVLAGVQPKGNKTYKGKEKIESRRNFFWLYCSWYNDFLLSFFTSFSQFSRTKREKRCMLVIFLFLIHLAH